MQDTYLHFLETKMISNNHHFKTTSMHEDRIHNRGMKSFRLSSLHATLTTLLFLYICTICSINCLNDQQHTRAHNSSSAQCPPRWNQYGYKCYKITYTPRNLETAKNKCSDLLAILAYIEDETAKDEETPVGQQHNGNNNNNSGSLISFLSNNEKPEIQSRMYFVNISYDLVRQSKIRLQTENASINSGDTFEHMDLDYVSDLWLPRDDPNYTSIRYNVSNSNADMNPGFVLAHSQLYKRWGLIPVSPSRRAAFICERPLSVTDYSYVGPHPTATNHHHHPTLTPKAQDMIPHASGISPVTYRVDENNQSSERRTKPVEKESATVPPQPEPTSNALFREYPQNQSIVLGSSTEMRCSSIESDSSLNWTFNNKNLTTTNRVQVLPTGTLRIEHVRNSDDGNYTCTIQSGGMSESKIARLEIIERPHQPEYITAELLDKLSTSVRIKWTPGFNGNSPITKYLVEMRFVNNENIENEMGSSSQSNQWEVAKANISADQTSVIIPDLKPARKYVFRIRAANRVGTGDPSLPTRDPIEVPVQPPSMPPENLSGTPRSSTSISIQWSPPPADSQNGIIKGYKIRHKLAGYATDWLTNDASEATHLNFVLDDLITWQNYEIQIAAENDKGVGPFSSSVFVRTKEGRPDKGPRNVIAEALRSTVIKINWNPPPPQHINGLNQGYRVQIWFDAMQTQLAKEAVVTHNSLTPLQTTTVDGLLPYTDYYISIKCFTNAGDGASNEEVVSVKTKQDLPEAVPSIEFADVLDKTLRVVWKPPKRINGELRSYILEYSELSSTDKRISKEYQSGITEARIYDLMPQTSYVFKIFPITEAGQGPGRMANITTSIPPVLPEPPSSLVPTEIGPTSVTIHFEPGFDGNAGIERWTAEALTPSLGDYKPRWQNIYSTKNHTSGTNTVVVGNLRPYTRYKIRLTPANVVGPSRYPSEPTLEFQTSQMEPEQSPKDLTIEDVRSSSVVAHWSPLSNNLWLGNPRGYNLTWSENGNSTIISHLVNDTRADSFLIKDLEESTEYTFRIYAVNDAGSSPTSEPVSVVTLEDIPSAGPSNLTAHSTSPKTISVDWNTVPKRHRNGIIRGYKIHYQAVKADAPLQHKVIEDNSTKHVILSDLKPFTMYHLAVAAYTAAGDGVSTPVLAIQTLEDTPASPQNLSSPTITPNTVRLLWDPPEDPNGEVLGYKVSYHLLAEGSKEVASHELQSNERTFKATNLKPDTHYVFTVTAKTKQGWGQQASAILYTHDSELRANLPFFRQSWFVILCACSSIVITIIVTALLFIQTKSYKYKKDAIKSTSQDKLGDAGFSIDEDPSGHYNNGFGLLSSTATHKRSNGALSQSTANFTLPKTPPRPNPGSVVYSDDDDDDDDVFEDVIEKPIKSIAGTSHYDSSGDSLTEKPSEISSSPAPESESADDEYANMAHKSQYGNHYANVHGTLRSQKSWRKGVPSKHYASHRTKPKLPQRPAPSVPQVPNDHGQGSLDNNSGQPVPGTSGTQSASRLSQSIYDDNNVGSSRNHHPQSASQHNQPPQSSARSMPPPPTLIDRSTDPTTNNVTNKNIELQQQQHYHNNLHNQQQQQNIQQADLLNNQIVSLNGGRIIVDNMAGSRAPLPGFTSFV